MKDPQFETGSRHKPSFSASQAQLIGRFASGRAFGVKPVLSQHVDPSAVVTTREIREQQKVPSPFFLLNTPACFSIQGNDF